MVNLNYNYIFIPYPKTDIDKIVFKHLQTHDTITITTDDIIEYLDFYCVTNNPTFSNNGTYEYTIYDDDNNVIGVGLAMAGNYKSDNTVYNKANTNNITYERGN